MGVLLSVNFSLSSLTFLIIKLSIIWWALRRCKCAFADLDHAAMLREAETVSIPALREGTKRTLTAWFRVLCGAAGDRTPVQTWKPYAFYMLSSAWFSWPDSCRTTYPNLSSCWFHPQSGTILRLAPDCVHLRFGLDQGMTAREMSRPDTWCRDEA